MRRIAFFLLLFACASAHGAIEGERWFGVFLDGRKIGHMQHVRTVEETRVVTRQTLSLSIERGGEPLTIQSEETAWETLAGAPLAFELRIDSAGSVTKARGDIVAGELRVVVQQQGDEQRQVLPWPAGALLVEGQRLAGERAGWAAGVQYTMLAFDAGSLRAMRVLTQVGALETVDIRGTPEILVPIATTMWPDGTKIESHSWVDPATRALRRERMPAIGLPLDVIACDRDCALAPVQPADVLAAMLVPAPRALRGDDLDDPLRYHLTLRQGNGAALDAVPGQHLERADDGTLLLRIDPLGDARSPPTSDDTAATRWLQSGDADVIALAQRAVLPGKNSAASRSNERRMRLLETFVRAYIEKKSLRVGYASAADVVRDREGDCTEHAVLLAAMARALGIPARVATGIAYSPAYDGQRAVFVPHAWVLAWIDGRWQGFDAALAGYDAGHIAFSVGDGDPYRFYEGLDLMGAVTMLDVEPLGFFERRRLRAAGAAK